MVSGKGLIGIVLAASALLAGGCNRRPRVVVQRLPVDGITEAAAKGKSIPSRPKRPKVAEALVPPGWIPKNAFPRPWRWIVIHHSASDGGSAATFDRAHRARGWDELGYHFVINNGKGAEDGEVEVGARWAKQKWGAHCKTPDNAYNDYGIGICLVGHCDEKLPSAAQLRSLRKLVFHLAGRYRIRPPNIIGHRDPAGTKTACPGDALLQYVHAHLRDAVIAHQRLARK